MRYSIDRFDMEMETLLPVRLKSRRHSPCIGNDDKALNVSSGFTKTVIHATAESIVKANRFNRKDQHMVASAVDNDLLDFDSYDEELNSNYGRALLQIVEEEGLEAYEALGDRVPENAYLHAAMHEMSVAEAAQELEVTPEMVIETDDGLESVGGGWSDPDLIGATMVDDEGNRFSNDLTEFTPDLSWVLDNWRSIGGSSKYSRTYKADEEAEERLEEFAVGTVDETTNAIVNKVERSHTFHLVKGIEEAVVADEIDRYVSRCGSTFRIDDDLLVLEIDKDSVDSNFRCGNCF